MARTLVAGVDSSTQSSTVVLRQLADGKVVGEARAPHPSTNPPRSEQDPASWWNALMDALKQLQPQLDQIAPISVGGQGPGFVFLGNDNVAFRPPKLRNVTQAAPH